jgi:type II secretory pathway pseudopilin PulG
MIRSSGQHPISPVRSGATLTEVLMSLLIMSIGIVSVITMFPLAVLRSIQATQLTNARMMTQNTEQAFRTVFRNPLPPPPPLGTGPNYNHTDAYQILSYHLDPSVINANEDANIAPQFRGVWQPNTVYFPGHIVTASRSKGSNVTQPSHWMICRTNTPIGGNPGRSGSNEPIWNTGVPYDDVVSRTFDGNVTWSAWLDPTVPPPAPPSARRNGGMPAYLSVLFLADSRTPPTFYNSRNYVLDPLGWATFNADYADLFDDSAPGPVPSPNDFGYTFSKATGLARARGPRPTLTASANANNPFALRINGGAATIADAEALATHPDSWTVEIPPVTLQNATSVGAFPGIRSVQFPVTTDLSAFFPVLNDSRIVLTSLTSPQTHVRMISGVVPASHTVTWDEPLPIGFEPTGPARIERRDRRFTWLATVNRDYEGHSRVTVATFFKRGLKPEEEHAYLANVGNPPATASVPHDQITVSWNPATEPAPLIREGNYLLDAVHLSWYRIVAVAVSGTTAVITVDRPVPNSQLNATGRVILMRGIVELFEVTL